MVKLTLQASSWTLLCTPKDILVLDNEECYWEEESLGQHEEGYIMKSRVIECLRMCFRVRTVFDWQLQHVSSVTLFPIQVI